MHLLAYIDLRNAARQHDLQGLEPRLEESSKPLGVRRWNTDHLDLFRQVARAAGEPLVEPENPWHANPIDGEGAGDREL